jgi:hypothetical protein
METVCSSETWGYFQTTRYYNPDDYSLDNLLCGLQIQEIIIIKKPIEQQSYRTQGVKYFIFPTFVYGI